MNPVFLAMVALVLLVQQEARNAPEGLPPLAAGTAPAPLPRASQPYIAPIMEHDNEFDWESIPLKEWLEAEAKEDEIPWKVDIKDSALRMDQRQEVLYTARIQAKELNKLGNTHELFFLSGVSDAGGKWMAAPKVVRHKMTEELPEQMEVRFTDSIFIQPGSFSLWLVLYDRETAMHNVEKRRIEVSELENDPLPRVGMQLPVAVFPRLSDREGGSFLEFYGGLSLPAENRRPLRLEVISVLSAPEQWAGRHSVIRSHNETTMASVHALSQMRLERSSISLTGLDIVQRELLFEQNDYTQLDWAGLADTLRTVKHNTVSAATLQAKGGAAFFRQSMNEKLAGSREKLRVFVVVSSSVVFGQGSDRQPMKVQGDCHCRVYHLRFRHSVNDIFDDLERVLKPLRPKTLNVSTPRDLRKALAEIMKDLASL